MSAPKSKRAIPKKYSLLCKHTLGQLTHSQHKWKANPHVGRVSVGLVSVGLVSLDLRVWDL